MSFGFSAGDFVTLVRLAHGVVRSCQQAGEEYNHIATEVRCLHIVLRIIRKEAHKSRSKIFAQNSSTTTQLKDVVDGCRKLLAGLDTVLKKYNALEEGSRVGGIERLWAQLGFGSKLGELGSIRLKIINYTAMISVLIDKMQLHSLERIEKRVENGFNKAKAHTDQGIEKLERGIAEIKEHTTTQFEILLKEVHSIASQKREEERKGAAVSSLSLSTYAHDEKQVWVDFRRTLIVKGYKSDSLKRHQDVLQAYMMGLDESGILDQTEDTAAISLGSTPWTATQLSIETNSSSDFQNTPDSQSPTTPISPENDSAISLGSTPWTATQLSIETNSSSDLQNTPDSQSPTTLISPENAANSSSDESPVDSGSEPAEKYTGTNSVRMSSFIKPETRPNFEQQLSEITTLDDLENSKYADLPVAKGFFLNPNLSMLDVALLTLKRH